MTHEAQLRRGPSARTASRSTPPSRCLRRCRRSRESGLVRRFEVGSGDRGGGSGRSSSSSADRWRRRGSASGSSSATPASRQPILHGAAGVGNGEGLSRHAILYGTTLGRIAVPLVSGEGPRPRARGHRGRPTPDGVRDARRGGRRSSPGSRRRARCWSSPSRRRVSEGRAARGGEGASCALVPGSDVEAPAPAETESDTSAGDTLTEDPGDIEVVSAHRRRGGAQESGSTPWPIEVVAVDGAFAAAEHGRRAWTRGRPGSASNARARVPTRRRNPHGGGGRGPPRGSSKTRGVESPDAASC
jgi:hypothetical protein